MRERWDGRPFLNLWLQITEVAESYRRLGEDYTLNWLPIGHNVIVIVSTTWKSDLQFETLSLAATIHM